MKIIKSILIISIFIGQFSYAESKTNPNEVIIEGLRLAHFTMKHKCTDKSCNHFSQLDSQKAMQSFGYLKGYVHGIRTQQAVGHAKRVINFPQEGVDVPRLVKPFLDFIESKQKYKEDDISISLYIFLVKHFPYKKTK
jgi:hypothetical protein